MGVKQFKVCFDLVYRKKCIMKRIVFSVKHALHWLIAVEEEQAGQSTSLYDKHCPLCLSLGYLGTQSAFGRITALLQNKQCHRERKTACVYPLDWAITAGDRKGLEFYVNVT